jgi:ferredoxin
VHPDCLVSAGTVGSQAIAGSAGSQLTEIEAEEDAVRVEVDPNICEGHGQCNALAPEVYHLDDGGYCVIPNPEVSPELESQAEQGALACPVQAITLTR